MSVSLFVCIRNSIPKLMRKTYLETTIIRNTRSTELCVEENLGLEIFVNIHLFRNQTFRIEIDGIKYRTIS